jgi:hypothetical protein
LYAFPSKHPIAKPPSCIRCRTHEKLRMILMEVNSPPAVLIIEPRHGNINCAHSVPHTRTLRTVSQPEESVNSSTLCNLTLGLTIDRIVLFHGQRYRHIGTIFNTGNHFWSVFPQGDRLYHCQLEPDQNDVKLFEFNGATPYKTGAREKTLMSQPSLHVYMNEGSISDQMETGVTRKDDLNGTEEGMDLDETI